MSKLQNMLTVFLIFLTLSGCESSDSRFMKMTFKTFKENYEKEIKAKNPSIEVVGFSGSIPKKGAHVIQRIDVTLSYPYKVIPVEEINQGRKLLLENLLILIEQANNNTALKNYVAHYPLNLSDFNIIIYVTSSDLQTVKGSLSLELYWVKTGSAPPTAHYSWRHSSKIDHFVFETIEEAVKKSGNPEFQKLLDYRNTKNTP